MVDELKKDEQNEQELTENEMEEVAGGWVAPGPLDWLKQA